MESPGRIVVLRWRELGRLRMPGQRTDYVTSGWGERPCGLGRTNSWGLAVRGQGIPTLQKLALIELRSHTHFVYFSG